MGRLEQFTGGPADTREHLNRLVDVVNGLTEAKGDGIVQVRHGPGGQMTVGLSMDMVRARLPGAQVWFAKVIDGRTEEFDGYFRHEDDNTANPPYGYYVEEVHPDGSAIEVGTSRTRDTAGDYVPAVLRPLGGARPGASRFYPLAAGHMLTVPWPTGVEVFEDSAVYTYYIELQVGLANVKFTGTAGPSGWGVYDQLAGTLAVRDGAAWYDIPSSPIVVVAIPVTGLGGERECPYLSSGDYFRAMGLRVGPNVRYFLIERNGGVLRIAAIGGGDYVKQDTNRKTPFSVA